MSFSSGRNLQNNINTTEAQTLSNKTLDNTTVIESGATITTPAIIDPSRSDVKKDTLANLQTYASTASNGQLCYATDTKKMFQVLDGALSDVGGGASGINYITNPDAEVNADGWNNYANTTPGVLPDDFGGTVNGGWSNIAATLSSPLRGSRSFAFGGINGGANDLQGHGVYSSFTVDAADLAKKMTISFDYLIDDSALTNAVDGMLRVYIYDEDKSELIRVNGEDLQLNANSGTHYAQFQTDSVSTNYRLVIHQALQLNVAEDYDIKMDNVQVGPTVIAHGTIVTDWKEFTPTGSWTTNTAYTGRYRRVGDELQCNVTIKISGSPDAVGLSVNLPDGLIIDEAKLQGILAGENNLGQAFAHDNGTTSNRTMGQVFVNDNTSISIITIGNSTISSTSPFAWASGDRLIMDFHVPIEGWSSNAKMSEDLGGREVVVRGAGSSGATIIANSDLVDFTVIEDTTGSWSQVDINGDDTFTVPETGSYLINVSIGMTTSLAQRIQLYVNGGLRKRSQFYTSSTITGSFNVKAVKGDEISITLATGCTLSSNISLHYIDIQKLASPQTILETETVAAKYHTNSGQSIPTGSVTTVLFDDKTIDTHNAYNTTTGVYTVPVSGNYLIAVTATLGDMATTNGIFLLGTLYKNGSQWDSVSTEFTGTNGSSRVSAPITSIIPLVKGDEIEYKIYQGAAGTENLMASTNYNHFSISRLK